MFAALNKREIENKRHGNSTFWVVNTCAVRVSRHSLPFILTFVPWVQFSIYLLTRDEVGVLHLYRIYGTGALSKIRKLTKKNKKIGVCSKSGFPGKGGSTKRIGINPQPKLNGSLESFKKI